MTTGIPLTDGRTIVGVGITPMSKEELEQLEKLTKQYGAFLRSRGYTNLPYALTADLLQAVSDDLEVFALKGGFSSK